MSDNELLLEVEDLHVEFRTSDGVAKVLNGVGYSVHAGETLVLVGESGCGKSTTGWLAARRLEPTAGNIRYAGREIGHPPHLSAAPVSRRSWAGRRSGTRNARASGSREGIHPNATA